MDSHLYLAFKYLALVFHMDDERLANIVFNIGSKNSTVILLVSLWQQMKLLQGLIPNSLQVGSYIIYTLNVDDV